MEGLELFDGDEDECKPKEKRSQNEKDPSIFEIGLLEDIPIELDALPEQRKIK